MRILKFSKRYIWTLSYILTIFFINSLFIFIPPVLVFGTLVAPGDIAVGSIYIVRDFAQREVKHYVIFAMLIGALLSYFLASKTVAIASMSAFFVGETIDWFIYTFSKRSFSQRILLSSFVSAPIDSVVFLYAMHMFNWVDMLMITLAKFVGIAALFIVWQARKKKLSIRVVSRIPETSPYHLFEVDTFVKRT